MTPKIRFGYVADNLRLKQKGITTNRTLRLITINKNGLDNAIQLAWANLTDLYSICKWNEVNNIKFYRITSSMCPHITNPQLIPAEYHNDYTKLAYPLETFSSILKKIGAYARKYGHRITMHPDPFISLGSSDPDLLTRNKRELYFHARLLDLMKLDLNSTITIHGGGAYGNKHETMRRWVKNFNRLPILIKRRLIIENDEFTYSIYDVLWLSNHVREYGSKLPVVFDIFHYSCYDTEKYKTDFTYSSRYKTLSSLMPKIINSWGSRQIKMHISEQARGSRFGTHAEFVKSVPDILLKFPQKYGIQLDLMIEAKFKEYAYFKIRQKYKAYSTV